MAKKGIKNFPPPLERSSYEFMAALMFGALTQLIPNWVAYLCCWLALAGIAVYFCWRSRGTIDYSRKRKSVLSLVTLFFICCISYGQIMDRYREANIIPVPVTYMTSWGGGGGGVSTTVSADNPPRVLNGPSFSTAGVDGRLLIKYKNRFKLMAVLFHIVNNEDYMNKSGLSKSALMNIRAEDMSIPVTFNEQYLREVQLGYGDDTFLLLAVPNKMKPSDFNTLQEAEDKGVQIIGKGSRSGTGMIQYRPIRLQ